MTSSNTHWRTQARFDGPKSGAGDGVSPVRRRAKARSRPGFEAVLAEHAPLLGRIAASYEASPAGREDLLQDIAIALWRSLPKWRGEASLRSFVARIAHNRGVDHVVCQTRHRHETMAEEGHVDQNADTERHASQAERHARLQRALRRLPLGQRQTVILALEGFSHGEIAVALGIKVNTVDARMSRARRRLADILGEQT